VRPGSGITDLGALPNATSVGTENLSRLEAREWLGTVRMVKSGAECESTARKRDES
jgi:hypothetical protein